MVDYVQPGYVRSGYIQLESDSQGGFTFDGYGRLIFVDVSVESFDVAELYSRWKDWVKSELVGDDSAKWLPALRYSGTDPIPGGFTGATFFTQNGWRVVYDPNITSVRGVLFSEDFDTPYWNYSLAPVFPVTVSAVVNQVTSTQNVVTGDLSSLPNIEQIVASVLQAIEASSVIAKEVSVKTAIEMSQANL